MSAPLLYLLVRLGGDCFAIEANRVVEIVPLLRLKVAPGAPEGSAGIMNYRGAAIPVLDLNVLARGIATASRLMTRIVIVRVSHPTAGAGGVMMGLLMPEVLRTSHHDPELFTPVGRATDVAGYFGGVLVADEEVIQLIDVPALLSGELRDAIDATVIAA